jgi:putative addiction module component (TIGR02574 family)
MGSIDFEAILKLDPDERIALVQAIWNSLEDEGASSQLMDAERGEVRRRIADHERNPSAAIPWDIALAQLRERHG